MINGNKELEDKVHQDCNDNKCAWFKEPFCAFWDSEQRRCNVSSIGKFLADTFRE